MEKKLYVVEFSSANYAGASEHCRVWAESKEDALDAAFHYANDFYYEQDQEQWEEENADMVEEGPDEWTTVDRAFLQEGSGHEQYINDPDQAAAFYPIVN